MYVCYPQRLRKGLFNVVKILVSFPQKEQVTLSLACELMSTDTVLILQFTEHSSETSNACGFLSLDSWIVLVFHLVTAGGLID